MISNMGVCKEIHIVEPHWEHVFHTEKKEMLTIFMGLQRHGIIRPHFTMHDMMEYLAYQEREAFMDRSCQMTGIVDGPSCLIWEVNILIKLMDIQREIDQELLEVKETSNALAIRSEISSISSPPLWAVKMAVKVIGYRFIYRPFAQDHHISEIVVDVVARLVHAMEADLLVDAANHALCLFLRAKAGSIAVEVLRKLPQDRIAYYIHLTAMRIVQSLQRKLKSMEIMKQAANCNSDELMVLLTGFIFCKLSKHFCSNSLPLLPGNILTLMLKASERKYPTASMKLVIHEDTVTCVLVFVLRLVFPDDDNVAAQLHVWPVLDEVVDRLAMCGARVTRDDRKDNFHIHIKEVIDMARSIYEQLLEGSGIQANLQYAVAARARMVSRDFASFVSEAILKTHQDRIDHVVGTSEKEDDPCLHQKNALRNLVARFVYRLFPFSDLLKCFQLADQLCTLIQQDITDKEAALPRSLDKLQESTVVVHQEIAGRCYDGYLLIFPVRDGWDIDSFLTDKEHCIRTKGLIVKSIIHDFKDILSARDEEKRRKAEQEAEQNAKDPEDTLTNVEEENEGPAQGEEECDAHITPTMKNPDTFSIASTISSLTPIQGFFRRMWRAVCCCATSQEED
ncbi:uncharacterized protein LOC121681509 isoform X1 [Alosa sapidissima]|uniref:uncharacterized protein LOC121681509 isoform X1 n=1 Tax=Alosa sapidissima TaxID=34773 RepID=UPI001C0A0810|nr:uncharacterized protein LOC121681509 isoform X1 [Alosa sapidissima]